MRIGLATCSRFPLLHDEERPLVAALRALGAETEPLVWSDPSVAWGAFDLVVVRSTWDYFDDRDAFVAWARRVGGATRLVNPPAVIAWNTHKGYLRELEARGVAIVPTAWCARGEATDLEALLASRGWAEAVVKPAVSAGARNTVRVSPATLAAGREMLARITATGDAMVQPYLPSVEEDGERSLLFAAGAFSHAIRKHALLAVGAIDPEDQQDGVPRVEPSARELAFAERVLAEARAITGSTFTYARVDIAPRAGGPVLMELEVTEPSLFLHAVPEAADRFARAILGAATHRGA
jgi:hypothetical protein